MSVMLEERPIPAPPPRVIRDAEFARRLEMACNGVSGCPPMHKGRLTWLQQRLAIGFNMTVSVETVRKWVAGEAKPRQEKTAALAEILQVDVAWLHIGVDQHVPPRERRVRNAAVDGVVNVVAGLIQMDGGSPAFPQPGDMAAERNHVDIHAIIRGAKYDFHIVLADAQQRFHVPTDHGNVIVLAVVRNDGMKLQIYELASDVIDRVGVRHGGSIEVGIPLRELRLIERFTDRL